MGNYYREKNDGVDDNSSYGKSFECETNVIGKTPGQSPRPAQALSNAGGTQSPQPLFFFLLNILVVFGDLLICLWLTAKENWIWNGQEIELHLQ